MEVEMLSQIINRFVLSKEELQNLERSGFLEDEIQFNDGYEQSAEECAKNEIQKVHLNDGSSESKKDTRENSLDDEQTEELVYGSNGYSLTLD